MVMFDQLGKRFLRAIRQAVGRILRVALLGMLLGALLMEVVALAVGDGWPPRLFTHLAAAAVAVALAYALGTTVALIEGVRGLVMVADHVDDMAKAAASAGINALDAVVDAVDGPDRHGFLGVRGPAQAQAAPQPSGRA